MKPAKVVWRVDLHGNGLLNVHLGWQGAFHTYDLQLQHGNIVAKFGEMGANICADMWQFQQCQVVSLLVFDLMNSL